MLMLKENEKGTMLTDEEILKIMHTHDMRRTEKIMQGEEVMSDEEFLYRLHTLLPNLKEKPFVNAKQAAAVYALRAKWECLPKNIHGKEIKYTHNTVRLQVATSREQLRRHKIQSPHGVFIIPLTEDQQIHFFGAKIPRTGIYFLRDILRRELGRWSIEMRERLKQERNQHKRPVGRPRKNIMLEQQSVQIE